MSTPLVVVSETQLRTVEQAIAQATHSFTDPHGERVLMATIDNKTLTTAALMALQIASGHLVWPANQKLVIKKARPTQGVLSVED